MTLSTAAVLHYARADIRTALDCACDPFRRTQYARSAIDYAATVLLAADAAADERARAAHYLACAETLLAQP
jgi:hypothetical protein